MCYSAVERATERTVALAPSGGSCCRACSRGMTGPDSFNGPLLMGSGYQALVGSRQRAVRKL